MTLPAHLFVSDIGGDLHDERNPRWMHHPVRKGYRWHHQHIASVADYKATLRAGPFAWPGGYPLFFLCDDGAALCFACARNETRQIIPAIARGERSGWWVRACLVNWEDTALTCEHCGEAIPSAYGEHGSDEGGGGTKVPNPQPDPPQAPPAPPVPTRAAPVLVPRRDKLAIEW